MFSRPFISWSVAGSSILALAAAGGLAARTSALSTVAAEAATVREGTIVELAQQAGAFKTLLAAAEAAGLVEALAGPGPLTVFAPTDDAFAALGHKAMADLLKPENRGRLRAILKYHVVPARVPAAAAVKLSAAPTLNGQRAALRVENGQLFVDQARVIKTDQLANNGVVHVIDRVLLPVERDLAEQAKRNHFGTLVAAAKAAGLVPALQGEEPLTVFAPTDEAFARLGDATIQRLLKPENRETLAAILKYHVVAGRVFADDAVAAGSAETLAGERVRVGLADGVLRVNDATITRTDVGARNGVIHVIDRVLLPESVRARLGTPDAGTGPRGLILTAIDRGVPLFNNGQPEACAAIYEVTALNLLALPEGALPGPARTALADALRAAREQSQAGERAWTLRRGLDAALATLPM